MNTDPSCLFVAITAHDTNVQTPPATLSAQQTQQGFRAIFVGVGGNVVVKDPGGTAVTFKNVPSGSILPVRGNIVTTASTATDMVALW